MMKETFYKLIKEASISRVTLDGDYWPIEFDTRVENNGKVVYNSINENSKLVLIIKDESYFFKLLRQYLDLEEQINRKSISLVVNKTVSEREKILMFGLLANATTEDFLNPTELLRRNIDFLQDRTFQSLSESLNIQLGSSFLNSTLRIQDEISPTTMETPHKIKLSLNGKINNEVVEYFLPSIYYGIRDENNKKVCYIYSLINPKEEEQTLNSKKYKSKINRLLFRLNEGIAEEESPEYFEYKSGKTAYYPEGNITDVTMSFVLALNIFMSLLQDKNITTIKAVPFLPIRYMSRKNAALNTQDEILSRNLLDRNDSIQLNLTNKFIRTFLRLQAQNKDVEVTLLPYQQDEFLHIHLNEKTSKLDNELLEETSEKINELPKHK